MPTYDYECGACGHRYEMYQSITAQPEKKCPSCGKRSAKRLIGTGAGVIFKGSGFYSTDYRSESYKKAAKAESEAVSGGKKEATSASGAKDSSHAASKPSKDTNGGGK